MKLARIHDDPTARLETLDTGPRLGEWYWVKSNDPKEPEWLGCAMKVGTNFVLLHSPHSKRGYHTCRVHIKDFWTEMRHEPDAAAYIKGRVQAYHDEVAGLLTEVKELTARLGMAPTTNDNPEAGALVVLSAQTNIKAYGTALVKAKEKDLPTLFEAVKEGHAHMATWMKAQAMPMLAQLDETKENVAGIDDRIFSVNLYAGLTEECVQCCKGKPAAKHEKLHVMQRMLFMDEESLLGYKKGGLEFKDLTAFDKFVGKPEHRDRILPYQRSLVAMRVRRHEKWRESTTLAQAFRNWDLSRADKFTYLYIRNGEQVWRLSCDDMDFGELIFPDRTVFNPLEPKMVKVSCERCEEFISVHEYDEKVAEAKRTKAAAKKWEREHPGENSWMDNPHRENWSWRAQDYHPVDPSSVYYDDAMAELDKKVKEYNRVALIIQGLFDRSTVLHPHAPVKSWTQEGFDAAIVLVNDGTGALNYGEPPDFEAYRAQLNDSLAVGSVTVGQNDYWQRREAEKENRRRDADYRTRSDYRPTHYRPMGNPGPADPSAVLEVRSGRPVFKWEREGQRYNHSYHMKFSTFIPVRLEVPLDEVLNVSAYQLGDYKRFFRDPRTRADYLQWAPLLLAAEEYLLTHPEHVPPAKPWYEQFNGSQ